MSEVYHERLKSPIPRTELERRMIELQKAMKQESIDGVISQNITQYLCGCNRWLSDTTAENNYPQSTILPSEGEVRYIACSGPPLDLYPPSHLLRIGKPLAAAPYFSPFMHTNDWEGRMAVDWIKEYGAKKIGIAGMEMFYWNYYESIHKALPDVEIVDVSEMFDSIRAVKSNDEISFIEKSADIQDKIMGFIGAYAQPGVREYELRSKVMRLITEHGGEEMIIIIGSAPRGEKFDLMPSFFQNRTLEKGDALYIKLQCSGPGGFYTSIGRMFSIGCEPSKKMLDDWDKVITAQGQLVSRMQVGADPQIIFDAYNSYLESIGARKEEGMFAYGQGYDHIERPSIQPGETMLLKKDMNMAVNINLVTADITAYTADSYIIKPEGPVRLHKTEQKVFRS